MTGVWLEFTGKNLQKPVGVLYLLQQQAAAAYAMTTLTKSLKQLQLYG